MDLLRILNLLSNYHEVTTLTRNYYSKYYYHHSKDDRIDRIIEYIYHNMSEELDFKKNSKNDITGLLVHEYVLLGEGQEGRETRAVLVFMLP